MNICSKCKSKNDDEALFCIHCGLSLQSATAEDQIEESVEKFTEEMEHLAKTVGQTIAHTAKKIQKDASAATQRIDQKINKASTDIENWYDRTFRFAGPLVASFLFLIFFRLGIALFQITSSQLPETDIIATILLAYLLPLFGITLLSNYTTYGAKKSQKFKVFSPLFHTTAIILIFWIIAQILYDLGNQFPDVNLQSAALTIENSLPTIFVFILLISYVILIINTPKTRENKP